MITAIRLLATLVLNCNQITLGGKAWGIPALAFPGTDGYGHFTFGGFDYPGSALSINPYREAMNYESLHWS